MTAAGQLRIVSTYDLGTLGPRESEPTLYHWHWYYSVPSLSLWVALVLAAVVPGANRRKGVLLVIALAAVMYGTWRAFQNWALPPAAAQDESISAGILSLVMGPALLWLLGDLLAHGTWRRTMLGALGIALGVATLISLSFRFEISAYTLSMVGGLSIPLLALVVGHTLAARRCRTHYRHSRFLFWLGTWMALAAAALALVFIIVQCAFVGWPDSIITLLGVAALAGLVVGVMAFLISLPFLLVGLRRPWLRERLFACLRLPAGAGPADAATAPRVELGR